MAPKKKSGGGNPRDQYFTAIKQQKLDTLRWCLRHGGVTHRSEDEDGHTGLMVAVRDLLPGEEYVRGEAG